VDFSSVGQVVGHRNCQPLFFVLVVETLAMAYARFGRESDLYVYEQADSLVGLRCKLNASGTTITTTIRKAWTHGGTAPVWGSISQVCFRRVAR
jgi:hypothetical protein